MIELFRETACGQLIRLVTRNKLLQYPEEKDPSIVERYLHKEKSANVAKYGQVEEPKSDDDDEKDNDDNSDGKSGSETEVGDEPASDRNVQRQESHYNHASGQKIDPEKGRDVDIIDWDGPDDPENPMNWSQNKKFFVTFEICLLTFSIYIGSAIYTSGLTGVMMQFGVSQTVAILGLTLFVIGYGVGPMLWSPMSEIPQIGRNPIYVATALVFVLLQLPVGYAVNIGMLLAFRFITGFVGSPCLATGGASLGDMYSPRKRAYAISIWGLAAICGPVLGPLVGGFAVENETWQWAIWELTWLSGFATVFIFFLLPETSSANILYRKTRRLRKLTGNDKLRCEPELMSEQMTGKDIVMMTLVRPFTLSFREPMVFLLNLYIALIYALLYCWFESFPIVFVEFYGFSLGTEGLAFLGILIGGFVIVPPFWLYLYKVQEPQFNDKGELQPEKRLPPACVGAFFVPACLFWFGWSAGRTHWIVPIIGSSLFTMGAFLLFNSVLNYLPDAYPQYAASVLAGNDLMRSSFGGAFPLFATQMFNTLGIDWGSSLLGFLAIAFIPIPFVLYKYGATLRNNHSKFAKKDE